MVYLKCFRDVEFCINIANLQKRCKNRKILINNKSDSCLLYLTDYCSEGIILPKLISFNVNMINIKNKEIIINYFLDNKSNRKITDFEYVEGVIIVDNKYIFCNNRFIVNLRKKTIKTIQNPIDFDKCMSKETWGRPFEISPFSTVNSEIVLEHNNKNLLNFKLLLIGNTWEQQNHPCNILSFLEIEDKRIVKQKNKTLFWTDNQLLFRDEKSSSKREFSKEDIDKILKLLDY